MSEDSKAKTALIYHGGLVQWNVMPFGLCNAPATFQRLMNEVFRGLPTESVKSYIDDVLASTRDLEGHLRILRLIFERLETADLSLHPDKCNFLMERVHYLGFILSAEGISADPEKVRAVREFPMPRTKTDLKSFLGLASYYRRFIEAFAKIAKPLTDALKGDAKILEWSIECQVAFEQLKKVLTEAPVLAYPDLDKPYFIETDGSKLGLGVILAQRDDKEKLRPVAFGSRTLRGAEVRYGSTDLEMLGVVYALKHFKVYVYGAQVTLLTDHKSLVDMLQKTHDMASDRQERWKQQIRNFEVKVVYRKGAENVAADALSRHPVADPSPVLRIDLTPAQSYKGFSEHDSDWLSQIRESQRNDPSLQSIIAFKEDGVIPQDEQQARWLAVMDSRFHMVEGILFYVDSSKDLRLRVFVPESERDALLWELHYSPLGGHLGMDKTLEKVCRLYYWPKLRQDVQTYLRSCIICASRSGQGRHYKPPLQPIPTPAVPFEVVAADIVKLGRTRDGNLYALVTTDLLSKFVIVSPMPDMTAETVVQVFLRDVLPFGAPAHVLTDQGAQFASELMKFVCDALQIEQLFTTTFHPQCDGQTERANQTLESMLSKCSSVRGDDWDRVVSFVVHAYNSSIHASTKDSPYHVLFGREPRLPSSSVFSVAPSYFSIEHDDDYKTMLPFYMQIAWDAAKEAAEKAKQRQKQQYDKTARVPPFEVGDRVFVQSKELYRTKLSRKYRGPGTIVRKTPTNAVVQLTTPKGVVTHKFHLDKLTKAHPEIGDRMFTGNPRQKVQPPSVQRSASAGTADPKEGRESTKPEPPVPETSSIPTVATPTPRYNLRPRSKGFVVRRVRLSGLGSGLGGADFGSIDGLLKLGDLCRISVDGMSSTTRRSSVSSGSSVPSWRSAQSIMPPWRYSQPPQRFQPYSFVNRFSRAFTRGDAASSRITLLPAEEPAVGRFQERTQNQAPAFSQFVPYKGSQDKVAGTDFVYIPSTRPFQQLDFYQTLTYRIQGQMYKNPFTETELNLEMLPPAGLPVEHSVVVDSLIFTHTGFRPNFPVQFDIISSRVVLGDAIHQFKQTNLPVKYFALGIDFVEEPEQIEQIVGQFSLVPHASRYTEGPLATSLTISSAEFPTVVIDLRKVCIPPVRGRPMSYLPPELHQFLTDPEHVFVMIGRGQQGLALLNLAGVGLQSSTWDRPVGQDVYVVDLSTLGAELGLGQSMGLAAFLRWTQDGVLPLWVSSVMDLPHNIPEGMVSRFCWEDIPLPFAERSAKQVAWVMYCCLHIVIRLRDIPCPLRTLRDNIRFVFSLPTVAVNKIILSDAAQFAWGQSSSKAEVVVSQWWTQVERVQHRHFCIWLDGLDHLQAALAEVSSQLKTSSLSAWDRQKCLHKFLLVCAARWRLKFEPQGWEPGATMMSARRQERAERYGSRRAQDTRDNQGEALRMRSVVRVPRE